VYFLIFCLFYKIYRSSLLLILLRIFSKLLLYKMLERLMFLEHYWVAYLWTHFMCVDFKHSIDVRHFFFLQQNEIDKEEDTDARFEEFIGQQNVRLTVCLHYSQFYFCKMCICMGVKNVAVHKTTMCTVYTCIYLIWKRGPTAVVIGRQWMFTPSGHMTPTLMYSEVRFRPFSDLYFLS
jgi:hypothetical protein